MPLEATTAADLAKPVEPIPFSLPSAEVRRRLQESSLGHLPVVDSEGRLMGVVRPVAATGLD
jgi:CBS domain-containing protein